MDRHLIVRNTISQVLWSGETLRHQGALESMAFALMGVEPVWNPRNIVDNFRLILDGELGRPRVDVIFTISGIYRDGLPEKVLLLDRAAGATEALFQKFQQPKRDRDRRVIRHSDIPVLGAREALFE